MSSDRPSDREIIECLRRSGYLLESRLIQRLDQANWFVEPNRSIQDPHTGKSREIDIVAEYFFYDDNDRSRCAVKTHFVIEAINNTLPLLILSPRPPSPNAPIEEQMRAYMTGPGDMHDIVARTHMYDLKSPEPKNTFSQYCSLSRKKGQKAELLASHSDDLHASFSKAVQYCSAALSELNADELRPDDQYWRMFFWQPMLVISKDLIVVQVDSAGEPSLVETGDVNLEFNFHERGRPRSMIVKICSEEHFLPTLERIVADDRSIQQQLARIREQYEA